MTSERHTYHLAQTWRIHYMQTDHNYNRHANTTPWQTVEGHKSPYDGMDQQRKVKRIIVWWSLRPRSPPLPIQPSRNLPLRNAQTWSHQCGGAPSSWKIICRCLVLNRGYAKISSIFREFAWHMVFSPKKNGPISYLFIRTIMREQFECNISVKTVIFSSEQCFSAKSDPRDDLQKYPCSRDL